MDRILLRGLPVCCVIGTLPKERSVPQRLLFDLDLYGDFSRAGISDNLHDAVDYTAVEQCILNFTAKTSFFLLERLAQAVVERVFADFPALTRVTLRIHKPGAPVKSDAVSLEIDRVRP